MCLTNRDSSIAERTRNLLVVAPIPALLRTFAASMRADEWVAAAADPSQAFGSRAVAEAYGRRMAEAALIGATERRARVRR